MKPTIVLIETSDIGAAYTAEAVYRLGYAPLFLCDLASYHGDPRAQILKLPHFICDTSSAQSTLLALAQRGARSIAGITSFADTRLKIASDVATALGVPGIDRTVCHLKDKAFVADLVPEFSPATVSFPQDRIPHAQIRSLFERSSRVIVKPVSGAGAFGTFCLDHVDEVERLETRILGEGVPAYMGQGHWIAQTFTPGQLISVEGFVHRGETRILGFTSRKKIGATESAATFPIDDSLEPFQRENAVAAVHALVSRSGFQNGYFHIEFMINDRECVMIDANIGRVGGGAIAEQLALSYGIDPIEVFRHILELTLFPDAVGSDPYPRSREETMAVFYGIAHRDTIESVTIPVGIPFYHTQILGGGAEVSPMGLNDWSWIGILSGRTRDTSQAIDKIRIHTASGVHKPLY